MDDLPLVKGSNKTGFKATKPAHSPKPKPAGSFQPGPLTPQEIASLRLDRQEQALESRAYYAANPIRK